MSSQHGNSTNTAIAPHDHHGGEHVRDKRRTFRVASIPDDPQTVTVPDRRGRALSAATVRLCYVGTQELVEITAPEVSLTTGESEFSVAIGLKPGLYDAAIKTTDTQSKVLYESCWVVVEGSLFGTPHPNVGLAPLDRYQTTLRDFVEENDLLHDAVDFDDTEIVEAAINCLDMFDAQPPRLSTQFNVNTFPFRDILLTYIHYRLFNIAAEFYRRNFLLQGKRGDQQRSVMYEQRADRTKAEATQAVVRQKLVISNSGGLGFTTGIPEFEGY